MAHTRLVIGAGVLAAAFVLGSGAAAVADDGWGLDSRPDTKVNTAGVNLDTDSDVDSDVVAKLLSELN